jgi:hypothetical protein
VSSKIHSIFLVLEKCDMFLQFAVKLNIHWMNELSQKSSKSIIKFVLINIYKDFTLCLYINFKFKFYILHVI